MPSIIYDPEGRVGHRWIDYVAPNGKRPRIRLGKVTDRQAQDFHNKLEALLQAKNLGIAIPFDVAQWLTQLPKKHHDKLVAGGIADPRIDTVSELCAEWKSTLRAKTQTNSGVLAIIDNLESNLGATTPIRILTEAHGRKFEVWLAKAGRKRGGPLAKATVSRRMRRAKQIFGYAIRLKSLVANPFGFEKGQNEVNRKKGLFG